MQDTMTLTKDLRFADFLNELNFDVLPSQTNIYGVTLIQSSGLFANKILVALLGGRIFVCEYGRPSADAEVHWVCKEVAFTYIPGKCHIISIDNFSCAARGLIIGVTFCKESTENFFNVYCNYGEDVPIGQQWDLDNVAQNCRSFDLSYTPYQLTHYKVECPDEGDQRTVFIVLGSDHRFHVYAQRKSEAEFAEEPVEKYFAELEPTSSTPTYLVIHNLDNEKRLTVFGTKSGKIYAILVDCKRNCSLSSWEIFHDSPIAQLQLFQDSRYDSLNLVVVSAREATAVYRNILENGFSNPLILSESDNHDCATTCAVYDVNFDGKKEILIGTYGRKLLTYAFDDTSTTRDVLWTHDFAFPLLKVLFIDMTGDSLDEMIVVSTKGVHTFQFNLKYLLQKCKAKLTGEHVV